VKKKSVYCGMNDKRFFLYSFLFTHNPHNQHICKRNDCHMGHSHEGHSRGNCYIKTVTWRPRAPRHKSYRQIEREISGIVLSLSEKERSSSLLRFEKIFIIYLNSRLENGSLGWSATWKMCIRKRWSISESGMLTCSGMPPQVQGPVRHLTCRHLTST